MDKLYGSGIFLDPDLVFSRITIRVTQKGWVRIRIRNTGLGKLFIYTWAVERSPGIPFGIQEN